MGANKIILGLAIFTALFVSGCASPVAGGGGFLEYGDAPDPTYAVTAGSDGARHASILYEWLGISVDQESGPKMVDQDIFDDGIGSIGFRACEIVNVPVTVTVKDRSNSEHVYSSNPTQMLYLNMVFDFDNNKSWGFDSTECDTGPVNEWQVRNYKIDVSQWPIGKTKQTFEVPIQVGKHSTPFCYRGTLSYGETVNTDEWTGIGSFKFGETEDYCPPIAYDGPFCGDGVVDFPFEQCDPPGSVCALGFPGGGAPGPVAYLCNNLCQCPVPDPPKYLCNDHDRINPNGAFNPVVNICQDNCPSDEVCDPTSCICEPEEPPKKYLCNNQDNSDFDANRDVCEDNCESGMVCDSSCTCVTDDREEVSCAENSTKTRTRGEEGFNATTNICRDDCSEGFTCDTDSCSCEKQEEVSCAGNTSEVDATDINNYESSSYCKDDCEQGYECNASSCTCTKETDETVEFSCSANTTIVSESGVNIFDSIGGLTCKDDCGEGGVCGKDCTCQYFIETVCGDGILDSGEECETGIACSGDQQCTQCTCIGSEGTTEVSCMENTANVDATDINDFDLEANACRDDCEQGYECNSSSCTCTMASSTQIDVLTIGGVDYPKFQFFSSGGSHDNCGAAHWHSEGLVFAIGGSQGISDPDTVACGFGKVGVVPENSVLITNEENDALNALYQNQ